MEKENSSTEQNEILKMEEPSPEEESHHSRFGPVLGILIIILVLLIAGLYLWGGMLSREKAETERQQEADTMSETQGEETLSTSDELGAIEEDLSDTEINSIEQDLNAIDAELEAELQ